MTTTSETGPGRLLYRLRGWVAVPPILLALALADPREPWQSFGVGLMACGEGVRLWGAAHLGRTARSSRTRTAKLVTTGPYAHTRHPLYWGNLLLTLGFALATGALMPWFSLGIGLGFFFLYRSHLLGEERALLAAFPGEAVPYYRAVPRYRWRWVPARCDGAGDRGRPTLGRALGVEAWTLHAEIWLLILLWIRTRM